MTVAPSFAALRERTGSAVARWQETGAARVYGRARHYNFVAHVLALGAQQVLCTAPLVVAVSAVVERVSGRGMGELLATLFGLDPEAAADVDRLFSGSARVSMAELVIGLLVALAFATGVAATQQRGFELVWGLPRSDGVRIWLRQAAWGIALALFVTAMVLAGRLGRWVGHPVALDSWTAALAQGVLAALFYWWGQRILLDGRVSYRRLLPGAVAVGIGILALTRISPLVLSGQITEEVRDYGLIGAVFVLSVWLMVLSAVLMGGVLLGVVIVRRGEAMRPVPTGETQTAGEGEPHLALTEPTPPA
ncbi:YhjD/YihY/BrkB family envelope integrity protein [Jatrophihabitans sp. YIM 134969]